jgi:hypothetical protein
MQNFDECRSYAEVVKSFDKCGAMHDHVYSHNISDHENIYEIHTTNHVDHSYSYSSPTENPDVKEPDKIQSTPYFKTDIQHEHDYYQNKIESVEISKSPNTNPFYHKETHQNSFKSTGSCSSPISYADAVKKVNVEEPKNGYPAASGTSFNNMKKFNSAVHTTSNSMKENHKSVSILAPTLSSSNISINETNFNVFTVTGDENLVFFIHSV